MTGCVLLQEEQIGAAGTTYEFLKGSRQSRQSAPITPFMNLDVPIGKGDATGTVMITCREIHQLGCNFVDGKIAVIDAVRPLVDKHNGIAWAGQENGRELGEDLERLVAPSR